MSLTLSTSIVATQTGHISDTNIVHQCTNGLIFSGSAFYIPATSVSDSTAGHLMWASARAAASGVASLDGSSKLPAAQLSSVVVRVDQSNNVGFGLGLQGTATANPTCAVSMRGARGNAVIPAPLIAGDAMAKLIFQGGYDAVNGDWVNGAAIYALATETFAGASGAPTNAGTQIQIFTTPNGSASLTLAVTIGQDQSITVAGALTVAGIATFSAGIVSSNVFLLDGVTPNTNSAFLGAVVTNSIASQRYDYKLDNSAALGAGTAIITIRGLGATDNAHSSGVAASIILSADAAFGGGSSPGRITFATARSAAVTVTNCAQFDKDGKFWIGATTAAFVWSVDQSGVVTFTDAGNIVLGTTTGTKIGTATSQKLGFWNVTPVIQYATTGTSTGFTAATGTAVLSLSTFTGNTGATAYTLGDVVRALKLCGIMTA